MLVLPWLLACAQPVDKPPATSPDPDPTDTVPTVPDTVDPPDTVPAPTTEALPTVFTIVLENHDYAEIVDNPKVPYINSLIAQYGLATAYHETGSPSLPNYLHMITGDNQGVQTNVLPTKAPYFPMAMDNLGTQLQAAGLKWRSYQESMGTPCLLENSGDFVPRHDPFLYFDDIQNGADGLCSATNVDYSEFAADLATGSYAFQWITPNMLSSGHDPANQPLVALQQADVWCAKEIPKILASEAFQNGGVLFLTWDEAEGRNGNSRTLIPMIVIANRVVKGARLDTPLTHASYLATVEDLLGLPRLPAVVDAPTLGALLE